MTRSPTPQLHRLGHRLVLVVLYLGVAVGARSQNLPTGFTLETVVGEPFDGYPVGFAFLPDGRSVIVEKDTGNIRVAALGAGTSIVIGKVLDLQTDGERGLLGIAVDPAWPSRPYLYCMATYTDGKTRITLHPVAGDLSQPTSTDLTVGSPYVILDYILNVFANHKGGTLRFGPDGMLYASTGDDGDVCETQDPSAYNGKILRLDVAAMPGAGTGPPPLSLLAAAGNPYPGPSDSARLVFAIGLRNPFRFTIDSPTGNLYIGDVGAHAWEEIDELPFSGHTGANLGWPYYEADLVVPRSCEDGGPPFVSPVHAYPHDAPAPFAVIAGPRYRRVPASPLTFPLTYEGDVFFHDHYGGWIRRLAQSQNTWFPAAPSPGQPDAENWATAMGSISDIQMGADGALYLMVLLGQGSVDRGLHRIVHSVPTDTGSDTGRIQSRVIPNPGRVGQGVTIRFGAASATGSRLSLYDAGGRLVRTLQSAALRDEIVWDGRDAVGVAVAPGLYFFERHPHRADAARGKILLTR